MQIKLKDVQQWFASKINKQVGELDTYDLFCAKVAYDYACEMLRQDLMDESVADVVTISALNSEEVARKLISAQFIVINKQDLTNNG